MVDILKLMIFTSCYWNLESAKAPVICYPDTNPLPPRYMLSTAYDYLRTITYRILILIGHFANTDTCPILVG